MMFWSIVSFVCAVRGKDILPMACEACLTIDAMRYLLSARLNGEARLPMLSSRPMIVSLVRHGAKDSVFAMPA